MSDHFILIGHPVAHSVSPAIHERAYELLGRSARYTLFDAADEQMVKHAVARIRSKEIQGANVTVPWKTLALQLCDRVDDSAVLVGAANVLSRSPAGDVVAHNTDALALADELEQALEVADISRGGAALVLGTGGAALAAAVSCARAGFSPVLVTGRRCMPNVARSSWPSFQHCQRLGAEMIEWPDRGSSVWNELTAVIQATSAGMKGAADGQELADRIPWERLDPLIAYDLIYNPPITPFLRAATAHGHHARGGLGMLVGQAARAIEIWWGVRPPNEPLQIAAGGALGLG